MQQRSCVIVSVEAEGGGADVDVSGASPYEIGMTEPPVVLKKYGNRRLYDTHDSRYVTLHEVEEMVQRGRDIQVVDAKTGDDLTKEVLVQIILDREGAREMLPTGFLKQVVRLSASPMKETFTRVLQDSLDGFLSSQRAIFDAQRNMIQQLPFAQSMWNPFAPAQSPMQSIPMQQMQQAPAKDPEVDRLRAEMSETQALLRQLLEKEQKEHGKEKNGKAKRKR